MSSSSDPFERVVNPVAGLIGRQIRERKRRHEELFPGDEGPAAGQTPPAAGLPEADPGERDEG
jgi:hypothetical protein